MNTIRPGLRPIAAGPSSSRAVAPKTGSLAESVVPGGVESKASAVVAGSRNPIASRGTGVGQHRPVLMTEPPDLSVRLLLEARRRVIGAYEEISRMQF